MQPKPSNKIRNIGIISHIDAGKTTVSERILYYSGETYKMGEVHDGQAVMDWMPQEQERGITITATSTTLSWLGHRVNLIDTPGHIDFTIEVERSMRVLDGAIAIFSAVEGVQPQSESVWRQADRYKVPRICFINKMDRTGADLQKTLDDMGSKLHARPVLIQLPIGLESDFNGVVDILEEKILKFSDSDQGKTLIENSVPQSMQMELLHARKAIIEATADFDDSILDDYLSERAIDGTRLKEAIRKGALECKLFPVLLGSALRNKGIQPLLDAVVAYLPSPMEVETYARNLSGEQNRILIPSDTRAPFTALAFKVLSEENKKLTYLRIYSGVIRPGMQVLNSSRNVRERIGRIHLMHAHKREQIEAAEAGDIVAVTGLKDTLTGDTLCEPEHAVLLDGVAIPEPVVSIAVEAKGIDDREKLLPALEKLQWEDPTFIVREDEETGQTILTGMGELHLEIIVDRLSREYGVKVKTGAPQVVLRETISRVVERKELFQHEIDGKMHRGEVHLRITPMPRGEGISIIIPGPEESPLAPEFLITLRNSLTQAASTGCKTGYPLTDIEIQVLDAPYLPGMTTELGLRAAAQKGMILACSEALIMLEPVMSLEIIIPAEYAGKVLGTLQQKHGQVVGVSNQEGEQTITARVPLAEMFGYMTELRSSTKGRGTYTMELSHFDQASPEVQKKCGLTPS